MWERMTFSQVLHSFLKRAYHWIEGQKPLSFLGTALFFFTLLLYMSITGYFYARIEPTGDECAYLLLAHSIAFDQDVDLYNNLTERDFQGFFHSPQKAACEPAFDVRGNGQWRSIHNVGLALLIALPYRLGGRWGSSVAMAGFVALMSVMVFLLAYRITREYRAALLSWACISFTLPVIPFVGKVLTEVPAAALLLCACYIILLPKWPENRLVLAAGVLLAFLPWLHTKYLVLGGLVVLWALFRSGRFSLNKRTFLLAGTLLFPSLISIALLGFFFQSWYGSPLPTAQYQISFGYPWFDYRIGHIYEGLSGLLFDQEFGWFFYAPVYLFAWAGLRALAQRSRSLCWVLLAATCVLMLLASTFVMWWGGDSTPGRFILPIVPFWGVALATALSRWKRPLVQWVFAVLALASLALGLLFLKNTSWLDFEDNDRIARPLEEMGCPEMSRLFPSTAVKTIRYAAYGLDSQVGQKIYLESGEAVLFVPPETEPMSLAQRLDIELPRGNYRIRCRMRILPNVSDPAEPLAILRLLSGQGHILQERAITPSDMAHPEGASFQEYDLLLQNETLEILPYTFQVYSTGSAAIYLESTVVGPAGRFVDLGQTTFWALVTIGLALWLNLIANKICAANRLAA